MVSRQTSPLGSLLLAAALSGCGGSSPSGGPVANAPNSPPPPPRSGDVEYRANWGLPAIDAAAVQRAGGTGRGAIVAVIDTGVDLDHPELASSIHPASRDAITGRYEDVDASDSEPHGTMVSGIVAAARDGAGMHGVAYEADLLVIGSNRGESFRDSDLAAATSYAAGRGADVINYSLGGAPGISGSFAQAMGDAAERGTVLVFAAGNGGNAEPDWPAKFAGDAQAQGLGMIVGAVDQSRSIASWSNRAGGFSDVYLVAPGVGIYTTTNGGMTRASGTSFAAPHVSGAVAALKDHSPHLTSQQIVSLLFGTATDLGAPGTDPVYGHGMLNLGEALSPQGERILPSGEAADGGGDSLESTAMGLGPAFGDSLRHKALRRAIFLDSYGRAYATDLSARIATSSPLPDLVRWLRTHRASSRPATAGRQAAGPLPLAGGRLVLGQGVGLDAVTGLAMGPDVAHMGRDAFATPFLPLAGDDRAVSYSYPLGGGTRLEFGMAAEAGETGLAGAAPTSFAYLAGLRRDWPDGVSLAMGIGLLDERGSLLGSVGHGAYALDEPVSTRFVTAAGRLPLRPGLDLFASAAAGWTDAGALESPLLSDFTAIRTASYSIGLAADGLLHPDGRLSLSLTRPLRVSGGAATADVPVGRTLSGAILRRAERVSLEPSGNEHDLELAYRLRRNGGGEVLLNALAQMQPGHAADAETVYAVGFSYRLGF